MNKDTPPGQENTNEKSSKKSSFKDFLSKPVVKSDSRYMQYSGLGITLTAVILVFLWIGIKLDSWLNTNPWLTLIMTMVGFFGGFYNFYINIQKLAKQDKEEEKYYENKYKH